MYKISTYCTSYAMVIAGCLDHLDRKTKITFPNILLRRYSVESRRMEFHRIEDKRRGLIPSLLESIRTGESKEEHSPAIRVPISRWSFAFPIKGTAKITPRAPRLAILSLPVRPVDVPSRKGYHVDEFWPAGVPYTRPFTFAANRRVARARLPSFAAWSAYDFLPRISH